MFEKILVFFAKRKNKNIFRLEPVFSWRPTRNKDLPILLYIHIPFCEELCPYCSFHRISFEETLARRYFEALRKEITIYWEGGFKFQGLYVGGGTPTILMDELLKTVELTKLLFPIREISVETNPNHLRKENIEILKEIGVDRLSVGIQSFHDPTLRLVKRYHKYGSGSSIAKSLLALNGTFNTLNVDMIFNFPSQDLSILEEDLKVLLSLDIDQITYYPLMVSSATKKQMEDTMGKMDYRKEKTFYEKICETLLPLYHQKTVWCFSKKHGLIDEYVVNFDEYAGLGSGSIGYIDGIAYANTFNVKRYIEILEKNELPVAAKRVFSKRERILYDFLMKLFGLSIDLEMLARKYRCNVTRYLLPEIIFFTIAKALQRQDGQIVLTNKGKYLFLVFMREFFTAVNNFRDYLRIIQ